MRRYVLTITAQHVGSHTTIRSAMGERVPVSGMLGCVQACDIGKRVYQVAPMVYQVENNEQRDSHLDSKAGGK